MALKKGYSISEELSEAVEREADETQLTASAVVRIALGEYFEKRGKSVNYRVQRWGGHRDKPRDAAPAKS